MQINQLESSVHQMNGGRARTIGCLQVHSFYFFGLVCCRASHSPNAQAPVVQAKLLPINQLIRHSPSQTNQSINQSSINQSINQSIINHLIDRLINQSIKQSSDQSINPSTIYTINHLSNQTAIESVIYAFTPGDRTASDCTMTKRSEQQTMKLDQPLGSTLKLCFL